MKVNITLSGGLVNGGLHEASSEDCLYLNVYAPGGQQRQALLPVLYWIHGGGYTAGSGRAQVSYRDVWETLYQCSDVRAAVLPLARRGGGDGALQTRTAGVPQSGHRVGARQPGGAGPGAAVWGVPGCNECAAQIAGLEWVRDNIAQFGGDPAQALSTALL